MPNDMTVRCECGSVEGVAHKMSGGHVNRVTCYCIWCQAFAEYLGKADSMLDEDGGSDLFQISPGQLEITKGAEFITSLRLSPKGPVRWYADCCKSNLANTFGSPSVPFMAMHTASLEQSAETSKLADFLGPIRARVNSTVPEKNSSKFAVYLMLIRYSAMLLKWRLTGEHKRSPFFNPQTGEAIVEPILLPKEEVEKLKDIRAKALAVG